MLISYETLSGQNIEQDPETFIKSNESNKTLSKQSIQFEGPAIKLVNEYKVVTKFTTTDKSYDLLHKLDNLKHLTFQKSNEPVFLPKRDYPENQLCFRPDYAKRMNKIHKLFPDLDWTNMIIAGGYVFGMIFNNDSSILSSCDIDLFVYGSDTEAKVKYLLNYFNKFDPYYSIKYQTITVIIPEIKFDVQIIPMPDAFTAYDVVSTFDLGYCQVLYDGTSVYVTTNALRDIVFATAHFDETMNQIHKLRLYKSLKKGLNVGVHKLARQCYEYCIANPNDSNKIFKETNDDNECVKQLFSNENYSASSSTQTCTVNMDVLDLIEFFQNEMNKSVLVRQFHTLVSGPRLIPAIRAYYSSKNVFYGNILDVLESLEKAKDDAYIKKTNVLKDSKVTGVEIVSVQSYISRYLLTVENGSGTFKKISLNVILNDSIIRKLYDGKTFENKPTILIKSSVKNHDLLRNICTQIEELMKQKNKEVNKHNRKSTTKLNENFTSIFKSYQDEEIIKIACNKDDNLISQLSHLNGKITLKCKLHAWVCTSSKMCGIKLSLTGL